MGKENSESKKHYFTTLNEVKVYTQKKTFQAILIAK